MGEEEMKVGNWFYGLGTAFAGMLDIAWGAFDGSHQPIQVLGKNLAGQQMLAYAAGAWLVAAGLGLLWRRSVRMGAAGCGIAYLIFAALWLLRYSAGFHAYGWRIDVFFGVSFGLAQQMMLVAPAAMIYFSPESTDSPWQKRAAVAARWMLGVPPVVFGLFHLIGIRVFATIVPQWMPFGYFWAAVTGIAFILAGGAICSGILDGMAARLLALMLLLFEGLVEAPPIFVRLHDEATWGAAVYNVAAIGACWIFVEFLASRAVGRQAVPPQEATMTRTDPMVA
jgi:hypothetical protein